MKFRSSIAFFVAIALIHTTLFAQQLDVSLNHKTDLDRAMCVFNFANRRLNLINDASIAGGVAGVGSLFLVLRANHFEKSATQVADAILGTFIKSDLQKNAFVKMMSRPNYFFKSARSDIAELEESVKLLSTINDHDLPGYIKGLNLNLAKTPKELAYAEDDFEAGARYSTQLRKLRELDDWLTHSKPTVRDAIGKIMSDNSATFINDLGMTKEQIANEAASLQKTEVRFANASRIGLLLTVAATIVALYSSAIVDPTHGEIKKYSSWDLPEVRKYLSSPDHQAEMENLAKQANQCDCK